MELGGRWIRPLARIGVVGVALYYAIWGGDYSVWDLRRIHEQTAVETERFQQAAQELDSLRALAARLETDPGTIERVARERFGMIKQGEQSGSSSGS